ncbi:MAG TPA: 1-phosphofructokinase [Ignavibacteria bacterium]|nr:1-phosphofructokinase [Ignavibacteria bacterium]
MILSVTINPLLERRFFFNGININGGNRATHQELRAGGKGININRQLNNLNINNHSFVFIGGKNGKLLREVLRQEKIEFTAFPTKSETRDGVVIVDEKSNKVTSYFGINSQITTEEAEAFKFKLEKMIMNCEIVVFSGSSPCTQADSIFPFGIETANKYNKISVCDTYGRHLKKCIEKSPTIVHNNITEVEKTFNISLKDEKSKLEYLDSLYKKNNIKQVYLTDDENPFYISNFDYHFKIIPPKIKKVDSLGSGDSFTAGIIYAWHNKLTFEEGLKIASALGAVNAKRTDTSNVNFDEAQELIDNIVVNSVGKKIIKLDVTPT